MRPERHALPADAAALRARLRHVYWLGGGTGGGKSTLAGRIATRYGLRLYSTDQVISDHAGRSTPDGCPYLSEFLAMDMDQRWVHRSPNTMLETFHWFRGEGFQFIVDDLLRLTPVTGVLVEGFRLLPHLVEPLLAVPGRAVWLLPTPAFQLAAFTSRGTLWQIADRTSDPPRALRNLLERDRMFTDRLAEETARLQLPVVPGDPRLTEDALTERVTTAFGL